MRRARFAVVACAVLAACGRDDPAPPVATPPPAAEKPAAPPAPLAPGAIRLTYYTMDGWPFCAQIDPVVHGMGKKHPGKVVPAVVDAQSAEGRAAIQRHGFQKRHGIVAEDAVGNVVYRYDGHDIAPEKLEEAVDKLVQ